MKSHINFSKSEDELQATIKNLVAELWTPDEFLNQMTKSITETIESKSKIQLEDIRN